MPAPAAAAAGGNAAGGGGQGGGGGTDWKWMIGRTLIFYFGAQALLGQGGIVSRFTGGNKQAAQSQDAMQGAAFPSQPSAGASGANQAGQVPIPGIPAGSNAQKSKSGTLLPATAMGQQFWPTDAPVDFYVFLSQGPPASAKDVASQYSTLVPHGTGPEGATNGPLIDFSAYTSTLIDDGLQEPGSLVVTPQKGNQLPAIRWSRVDWSNSTLKHKVNLELDVSEDVRTRNGTIWADIYMTLRGVSPDPSSSTYTRDHVFHSRKRE